jgi:hypothetical protein
MRFYAVACALLAIGSANALAADLRQLEGVWGFSYPGRNGTYSGQVSIDANGAATSEVKSPMHIASQSGNVAVTGNDVTITFLTATPSTYNPDTFHCSLVSPHRLRCSTQDRLGSLSTSGFVMTRAAAPTVSTPNVPVTTPNVAWPNVSTSSPKVGAAPHVTPGGMPAVAAPDVGERRPAVAQPTR